MGSSHTKVQDCHASANERELSPAVPDPTFCQEESLYTGEGTPETTRAAFMRLVGTLDFGYFGYFWQEVDITRVDWDKVYDSFEFDQEQLFDVSLPLHLQ